MASYDPYDREPPRRYVREERREERDARYFDSRDYGRPLPSRELVPRAREESDLSVEEIRRDFPPPSGRDIRRARSAEHDRYYEEAYDYRHDRRYEPSRDRDHDRGLRRGGSYYEEEERRSKQKGMSKQEKIIAAVAGAALLAGGKEIYDRYEAKQDGLEVNRNPLSSVALAGFGALAGYQGAEFYSKQQARKDQKAQYILHRGRHGQVTEYYSDDDEEEEHDSRHKRGHKNFLENALAATGLGAAVKTLTGGGRDDERHGDDRSRGGSPARSHAGGGSGANKIQQAAIASLLAGATEAFRVAKEPGGWKGEKTKRILTAAAGAATVDAARGDTQGKLGLAESVIGGLVGNRLINGSKREIEEDRATGRSRSRSRSRAPSQAARGGGGGPTGLAALATAGLGALGAKAALDHRPRSRSRAGSRDRSRDRSYDSRDGSPDRHRRSRSRSVVDKARNSLAKLGIGGGGGAAAAAADDHRRRDQDDFDDGASSRRSRRYYDEYDDDSRYDGGSRSRGGDYEYESSHRGGGRRDESRRGGGSRGYGSASDLGDSDEDERKAKKMRGKQIITTGLATVATIHAAHGVYQSMEKRTARQKAVKEGRLSAADAKKLKTKAFMKDAASVGIAAMGIRGAFEELKEAKEMTHECKAFQEEKAMRHEKREQRRKMCQEPGDKHRRAESWAPSRHGDFDGHDRDDYGPRYYDDNPYSSGRLPAPPPMGYGQ
ncbi:hypothetical protein C2857_001389 [Epichloe festucae Fl1]|uniref:DUF3824 domain-containing protein n=1 Tax=Epichloe festucae (strain Fl1) TaxID=877507 RepID=A0A7S9KRH9_EPIFF|nr:hypothetical protein C2857_001389 [Epichloe festucae Fl1]